MKDRAQKEREQLRERTMAERMKIISQMERERRSKVITLIHRREPWLQDGEEDSLTIEDSEHVLMQIRKTSPEQPIDIIIHTPGGLILAAEMIAMALKRHPAKVTAIVPLYAMSGGTLITLAADEILMESYSVLGPLDPQINGRPANALVTLLERKPVETVADDTVILADIARQALQEMQSFIRWLLQGKLEEKQVERLAEFITGGYITHDTPISLESARELGLNVIEGVPSQVYELFETCHFGDTERPRINRWGLLQ